jgi:hypothetical protein
MKVNFDKFLVEARKSTVDDKEVDANFWEMGRAVMEANSKKEAHAIMRKAIKSLRRIRPKFAKQLNKDFRNFLKGDKPE